MSRNPHPGSLAPVRPARSQRQAGAAAEHHILDRAKVRSVVEAYWRNMIVDAQAGRAHMAAQRLVDFQAQVQRWAADMPADDAAAFIAAVDAERGALADMYEASPEAIYQRLGIPPLPGPRVVVRGAGVPVLLVVVVLVLLALLFVR